MVLQQQQQKKGFHPGSRQASKLNKTKVDEAAKRIYMNNKELRGQTQTNVHTYNELTGE